MKRAQLEGEMASAYWMMAFDFRNVNSTLSSNGTKVVFTASLQELATETRQDLHDCIICALETDFSRWNQDGNGWIARQP